MKKILLVSIFITIFVGWVLYKQFYEEEYRTNIEVLYQVPKPIIDYFEPDTDFYAINFFSSWCNTCRAELENLKKIKEISGIKFYGIAVKDFSGDLKELLGDDFEPYEKVALDFPINDLKIVNLSRIPRTLLVYQNNVIYDHTGEINKLILKRRIMPIINEIKAKKINVN